MPEPLMLTISNDAKLLRVSSWQELIDWLEEERAKWAWLLNQTSSLNSSASNMSNTWNQMLNRCNQERNTGHELQRAQGFLAPLTSGEILYSGSLDGVLVHDILSMAGQIEASAAAAFITRQANLGHAHDARSLRGMLLVALPNLQSVSEVEMRLRKERANYRDSLRRSIDEAQSANLERSNQFAHLLGRARRLGMSVLRSHRTRDDARLQHFGDEFTKARASIGEVENTYREYMKLRAPVEYWESKASEHGKKRVKAFATLRNYFLAMGAVLLVLFGVAGYLIYNISRGDIANPLSIYLVISGALAVISTIAFWFGRLLTRIYLSEHHLQTDAEERAVMARTFLALINEGAAVETDKDIILAALFRATQDGIINDDGPPDLAIQTLAARLLTGRGAS